MPITHVTIPVPPAQVGQAEWAEAHTLPTAAEVGAADAVHGHAISDVTGLQTALDGKQAAGSYAAATHTHAIDDVTGLQTALDGKSATSHSHSGLAPTGGTTGQVLKKSSNTDYDYAWAADATGGGGGLTFGAASITVGSSTGSVRESLNTVTDAAVSSSSYVNVWLAPTTPADENEVDMLEGVVLAAFPGTGTFDVQVTSPEPLNGAIKIQYSIG